MAGVAFVNNAGRVQRFEFVNGPQTGHRSAAVRPRHGSVLLLLLGHVLGDRLVDGESWTFHLALLLRLFQRSAVTAVQRVVAGDLENALARQFVGRHLELAATAAAFADSSARIATARKRKLRLFGSDIFQNIFDDGLGHRPAESFDHVVAEQRLARLGEILQLVVVAAMASRLLRLVPAAAARRETLVVLLRVLARDDDVRYETLLELLGHLLLPEAQLRQFHDGGHTVGSGPLVLDAAGILVALLARFLEEPRASAGARRRRIHRRRRLRLGILVGFARAVRLRLADGLAASAHHSVQEQFRGIAGSLLALHRRHPIQQHDSLHRMLGAL